PGYLSRKGFSLVNGQGETVDPYSVNWAKYKKGIPYRVVQGSGDANALGVIKFNFPNKYAVYLHDTNQRYLFAQKTRSLSHGCVRVENWMEIMKDILVQDSVKALKPQDYTSVDSVKSWLADKKRKVLPVKNKLPVFIRYFTCEGKNGKIEFFDDIYGEDRQIQQRYYTSK
ncbi:MAG: peptidoglycan-binding protein, partial [Pedobacter sp.]